MIKEISDLNLSTEDSLEVLNLKIKEGLGIDISLMQESLSKFVVENSLQLVEDFVNIVPYGDYSKMLESPEEISNFLKEEASKIDNWKLYYLSPSDVNSELIQFVFANSSVDEGDSFRGYVFVSKSGKIRHVFTQVE